MKFILILLFIALPCLAAKNEKGYSISTELTFKDQTRTIHTKNKQILEQNMNEWAPMNSAENGIVLLGRKTSLENQMMKMEFMIIDTSKKPMQISQYSSITQLGSTGSVSSHEANSSGKPTTSVSIKFLPQSVNYQSDK